MRNKNTGEKKKVNLAPGLMQTTKKTHQGNHRSIKKEKVSEPIIKIITIEVSLVIRIP